MFKKSTSVKKQAENIAVAQPQSIKYQHPKILLVDLDDEVRALLEKEGYNICVGTFGRPYRVQKDSNFLPVVVQASLPNYTEQEIIVADLMADEPVAGPPADKMKPMAELDWWAKCSNGEIDPRPRAMAMVQDEFERIHQNGGAFIVFADARLAQNIVHARHYGGYNGFYVDQEIGYDNWSLLSVFSNLTINSDHGEEITPVNKDWPVVRLLSDYLDKASFCCTFNAEWRIEEQWCSLANNKYGASVAGFIAPADKTKNGWIFIFPRIRRKAEFLTAFLKNILPNLSPLLFPHAEGQRWVHRPEYEMPSVLEKAAAISAIQDEAANKITELEKAIESERNSSKFLYDLIRETGGNLVIAVQKTLAVLGFTKIIDVDEEMKKVGKDTSLREDLRIHDISPVLVVDIKGVAGKPADAEALQAQKHAFIYIQEQNRADVRGLTIINHQRLLPPLDRDNEMPFRKEILDNAEQVKLGLITTWDLFRLVRGLHQNAWKPDQVIPLLYRTGRIYPTPVHYQYLGKVKHVWKKAFSVLIEKGALNVGERVAVEFPVDFHEQLVSSMQFNDADVKTVTVGQEVGIHRNESAPKVKEGFQVYRITV